jgi:DNA processing protein
MCILLRKYAQKKSNSTLQKRKEKSTISENEKKCWIWATLIKGIGARKKLKIINQFNSIEELYNATKEELLDKEGIGENTAKIILNQDKRKEVEQHLKYINNNNIEIITIKEKEYPQILKQIYDPPIAIYLVGNKKILNNLNIAIIGCRECSNYGKNIARKLAYNIAKNKINIISGLAKGIDIEAHIGTLEARGKTIAVLGNGIDTIYPKENIKIAKEIIKNGGAIITEYPLGTKPEKKNFPERNRIVSGMSKGIIVVEAKEKSGTLITVDFALEQGRDVFVVPGNLNSENSIGTNELIKQGAKIITDYRDIIEEYKY